MSHLIAFWSPSHAGASTLLLNVACAFAVRHAPFVVADFNLTTPSLALYADALPYPDPQSACLSRLLPALEGGRLQPDDLTSCLLQGPGFPILPGFLDVSLASHVSEGHIQSLLKALRSKFELVLVDVTPALDSVGSLPVLEAADLICLVTTPDIASRFHTRRNLLPLCGTGIDERIMLLVNRAGKAAEAGIAEELGVDPALTVTDLPTMASLIDAGRIAFAAPPIRLAHRRFQRAIEQLTAFLVREVSAPGRY